MSINFTTNDRYRSGKFQIYCLINTLNKKRYIGLTVYRLKKRLSSHFTAASSHKRGIAGAIAKYGKENWHIFLIDDSAKTFDELCKQEIFYIKKFGSKAPNGYNLTDGGEGTLGWKPTKEQCEENSIRHKKYWKEHPEIIAKMVQTRKKTLENNPSIRKRISLSVKKAYENNPDRAKKLAKWFETNSPTIREVEINGTKYPKIKDAAMAIGISHHTITNRINRGVKGYRYADQPFLGNNDVKQINGAKHSQAKKVEIDGIIYDCIKVAAEKLGINYQTIYKRFQYDSFPNYKYIDKKAKHNKDHTKACGSKNGNATTVRINNKVFNAIVEAAEYFGLSIGTISGRIKNENYPEYQYVKNVKNIENEKQLQLAVN